MIEVLDSLNTEYRDNIRDCFEQVEHVAGLFPPSVSADSLSLAAELENFVTETEETYISRRLQMPQTSVH